MYSQFGISDEAVYYATCLITLMMIGIYLGLGSLSLLLMWFGRKLRRFAAFWLLPQ